MNINEKEKLDDLAELVKLTYDHAAYSLDGHPCSSNW